MSRSGYSEDYDGTYWEMIKWRGAVESAISGKRGQAFLIELRDALDALPKKRLVSMAFQRADGEVCALGALGIKRGIKMPEVDEVDVDDMSYLTGELFGIPRTLAAEIMYVNDQWCNDFWNAAEHRYEEHSPESRYIRVYAWLNEQIGKTIVRHPRKHRVKKS